MHTLVERAGTAKELPDWARCGRKRYAHSIRVGDLLETWATSLGIPDAERIRWRAAGVLHDALKDASDEALRALAGAGWPDPVAHAPACAARLRADGVEDDSLLDAITYHPVGHPDLDDLGKYLILADYMEPGRDFQSLERASLRDRLPADRDDVLAIVVGQRLTRLLEKRRPLMKCSVDSWNRLVGP
ncbi:MAG: HD domain-containing protein [Gemmatimonadota bacterium]